ncbi:MAG TPA: helix-hairpin-helix domain-containing protein [Gaiellaceae bacterium]
MPPVDNAAVAARLEEYAALLELAGAGYYTSRAYRRAAATIRALPAPVSELVAAGRVRELRGIGPSIEARLRELVETGDIQELRELERTLSPELAALGRLHGFGAKRGAEIGRALGIRTGDELLAAARAGRLREVPGIGPKVEARILEALERGARAEPPRPLLIHRARPLVESIAAQLGGVAAGDPRRWKDASSRLAVAVAADDPEPVRAHFAALPEIVALAAPDLGVTVEGVPVQLVVAPPRAFGAALVRATGSPEWVAAHEPLPDAPDEEGVFRALGIDFVPPELRESAAVSVPGQTPLLELSQIRGDLHAHTTWSDGRASVPAMGEAARVLGHEYLAICDHSPNVRVVPGLDADMLRRQGEEIAAANELLAPFRVLRGLECDIRRDGSLDAPDDVLAELEWVQLSLHAGQRLPRRVLTDLVTEAMRHPAVRCLSHPTGRLIGHRPENALDLERTFEVALETGVALEVNGLPDRLDLSGEHVREALSAGVTIVCSTDAHSVAGLQNLELSVRTACRGGATAADVLNTRPVEQVLARPRRVA